MSPSPDKPYFTLDDLDFRGKVALVRVDVNSPIEGGRITSTKRIDAHADTVKALAEKGARIVVLGHQGRKGGDDFTDLSEHARILQEKSGVTVTFVDDVHGEKALAAIRSLADGEAVMLDNVRGVDAETAKGDAAEHANAPHVKALADVADYFVNDAFSAAHRSQASLVGFTGLLPSAAGVQMDNELTALAKAVDDPERPSVYFLGGAKPEDSLAVMRANFRKGTLDTALLGGVVANLFLVARGHDIGHDSREFMESRGVMKLLPAAEELLEEFDAGIVTPEDVAVKGPGGARETLWLEDFPPKGPILDIGEASMESYEEHIMNAGSLMMNGPAGLYEEDAFGAGTEAILRAFKDAEGFSLLGGGHTTGAMKKYGFEDESFGYVSLAGGALMAYLTGEDLPVVEALKASKAKFAGTISA